MKVLAILLLATGCLAAHVPHRPRLDGRIVGGHDVDIEDFPHQLSLQYNGRHICGASIISANWVLTASHCVDGSSASVMSVRAGSSNKGEGGEVHKAKRIVMHPKYGNLDWDFALIEVATPFSLGKPGINAIKLTDAEPAADSQVTVSGWGALTEGGSSPRHLQAVTVPVVSRSACKSAYGGSITERMICAGLSRGGKDSCQGDSGGPLINSNGVQVGVVSWGRGCAEAGYPGVYSNIAAARSWINEVTGL